MRSFIRVGVLVVFAVAGMLFVGLVGVAEEASGPGDEYVGMITNDAVWYDTDGNEIWCNGGDMTQVDDTFYWIGYETGSGRRGRINLYSSKNLADWKFENTVLTW